MAETEILVTSEPVSSEMLAQLAQMWHGTLVKGVADIECGVVALGGEWHMDANNRLIAEGSAQPNLWGFNIHPKERGDAAIEYTSLINIRPAQGNRSMEITSPDIRAAIRSLAAHIVPSIEL